MKFDLESSILGSLVYTLTRITQSLQSIVPWLLWWIAIKPLLYMLQNPNYAAAVEGQPTPSGKSLFPYCVDKSVPASSAKFTVLMNALCFSSWWSGMLGSERVYERLLIWNPKFPVLGYEGGSVKATVETLGRPYQDGSRGWDLMWISSPVPRGRFQIIKKEIDPKTSAIVITCVWTTGPRTGKVFTVGPGFARDVLLSDSDKSKSVYPSHVYSPPRPLVIALEVFVSASFLLPLLGLAKQGWPIISSVWQWGSQIIAEALKLAF